MHVRMKPPLLDPALMPPARTATPPARPSALVARRIADPSGRDQGRGSRHPRGETESDGRRPGRTAADAFASTLAAVDLAALDGAAEPLSADAPDREGSGLNDLIANALGGDL